MLLDVFFILLIFGAVLKGLKKGLIAALFSLIGHIAGFIAAMYLSEKLAALIQKHSDFSMVWLPAIAFLLVFISTLILVKIMARALEAVFDFAMLGWLNKSGGILLYIILYLCFFIICLHLLIRTHIIGLDMVKKTHIVKHVEQHSSDFFLWLNQHGSIFYDMTKALSQYFNA
jgi:membrane protein required for colicin V production